ncbi:hypothetical protein CDL12_02624 [Handroanthus impetiginosus]|uniref:Disease resistance protein At4g27190-like leucine-rich repeats domain-containing protein n=1 Tax=Handroanthus impetiginosus TaxID=429701 RepID=A0A2G9I4F5_9LAMI|nr:hypothetical protein CDL12_02624 [Handroanthus impetiginosus]
MEELVNLRFLSLYQAGYLNILPKSLFLKFALLQCFHLPFQIKARVEEIVRLKHFEEFWGLMKSVSDVNKYIRYKQSHLTMFKIIVLGGFIHYNWLVSMYDDNRNEVILHQCNLQNEEEEDLSMLFFNQGTQILTLKECEGLSNSLLDDFPRSIKLSFLKVLKIDRCRGIEYFLTNKQFLIANQEFESRFLSLWNLEEIKLIELPNFVGLIQNTGATVEPQLPQVAVFSFLRSLSIWGCDKMRKLGLPLSEFQNLEDIKIVNCIEIEEIIEVREEQGQVVSLPKLKKLGLWNLPRLKSICNTAMSCGSIWCIQLAGCPKLKKLPRILTQLPIRLLKLLKKSGWMKNNGGSHWSGSIPLTVIYFNPCLNFIYRSWDKLF